MFEELPFTISLLECSANKSIAFYKISQPGIKRMVKRLCWYELKMQAAGTAIECVYSLTYSSKYLKEIYPEVSDVEDISYEILHNYTTFLKINSGLASKTIKARIEAVDKLLETIRLMEWAKLDPNARIKHNDLVRVSSKVGPLY